MSRHSKITVCISAGAVLTLNHSHAFSIHTCSFLKDSLYPSNLIVIWTSGSSSRPGQDTGVNSPIHSKCLSNVISRHNDTASLYIFALRRFQVALKMSGLIRLSEKPKVSPCSQTLNVYKQESRMLGCVRPCVTFI